MNRSANLDLTLIVLILSVLGCVCPNSSPRSSHSNRNINVNAVSTSVTPYPTPYATANASPSPEPPSLSDAERSKRVKSGEAIYKRIAARTGLPIIFGWRARDITIGVPTGDWNGLSKEQQVDLTYYVEHLVQEIKADPVPYVNRWTAYYKRTEQLESGGEYDGLYTTSYLQQVRQLCYTCWNITIGKAKRDGFYDESTPVSGGTVQEFRASENKTIEKTSVEKDADDFKTFAASMTAGEHLKAATEALESNYNPSQEQFGNTELARKHIKAISKNAPEYSDAQKLMQRVIKRERERKQFQDAVVREMKRLTGTN